MENQYSSSELWDQAKNIEKLLPIKRQEIYDKIKKKYPLITYKNFVSLNSAFLHNKLTNEIREDIVNDIKNLEELKAKAKYCREESDRLIQERLSKDTRTFLDPKTQPIPADDIYQKLANCTIYPLRQSCNNGENKDFKWERCEYMKYDNSKSIFDGTRWICTYDVKTK